MYNFKPFYKSNMELLDELKKNVVAQLDQCEPHQTPFVCANTVSEKSKDKMVDLVIKKVLDQKINISQAIVQIETELDPNSYTN